MFPVLEMVLIAAPNSSAYDTGRMLGYVFWPALLLAGVLKCNAIAQRPTTNAKSCYGLALVLFSFLGFMVVGWLKPVVDSDILLMAGGGICALILLVGVILSIIGIIEYVSAPLFKYKQGLVQGITAIALSLIPIGLMAWGAADRLGIDGRVPSKYRIAQKPAGSAHTFSEFNFKISNLPDQWVQVDAKKLNPLACVAFVRTNPQLYMLVIAERAEGTSGIDTDLLADVVKANMKSGASSSTIKEEVAHTAAGIQGKRLMFDADVGSLKCEYMNWVGAHQGYCYQILFWKDRRSPGSLRAEADKVLQLVSLIDPKKTAGAPTADVRSDTYGYSVQVANTVWSSIDLGANFPDAAHSFSTNNANLIITGFAVPLGDLKPSHEALMYGLLQSMNIDYPNDTLLNRRELKPTDAGLLPDAIGFEGCEFDFERRLDNSDWTYKIRILRNGPTAVLWAGWHIKNPATKERDAKSLAEGVALLKFHKISTEPVLTERMKDNERTAVRDALNNIGHYYFNAKAYSEAANYYQASFERDPKDAVIFNNWLGALVFEERNEEALQLLEKHFEAFKKNQPIRSRRAYLLEMNGRPEEAIKAYSELFAEGHENANDFATYLRLLQDHNQGSRAVEEIEKRRQKRDTNALAIQHAQALAGNKEVDKAIAVLEERQQKVQFHPELAFEIIEHLKSAERYNEGLKVCETLVQKGFDTPQTWLEKGRLEYKLKWFTEAKASFETAAKKAPKNETIRQWLDSVSGMLGEGQNSAIKNPIAPVAIPDEMQAAQAPQAIDTKDPYIAGQSAYYLRNITAIQFSKNKEYKTTEHRSIKVVDAVGVSRFSSFQFGYDPLSEEIFVNNLTVRDGTGKVVTTGKASDYYVIDEGGTQATQRKELNVPVPGLQPGYTLDITVTRRNLAEPKRMEFFEHYFSGMLPVLVSGLVLRGDLDEVAFSSPPNVTPFDISGSEMKGRGWSLKNPPIYRWENGQPAARTYLPHVILNQKDAKWDVIGKEYLAKIKDVVVPDPALDAIAREKAAGMTTDAARLAALHDYLSDNYTYKAIEFGRRAQIPNTPATIVRNKYGDCKDLSVMMHLMLKALGVESHLALSGGTLEDDKPSMDQFNHMILYIPSLSRFYDGTNNDMDPTLPVPQGLAGRSSLVLDPAKPRLEKIPSYPESAMKVVSERKITISADGDAEVSESMTYTGYFAVSLRQYLNPTEPSKREQLLRNDLIGSLETAKVNTIEISGLEARAKPLTICYQYSVPKAFKPVGAQWIGNVPAPWEKYYLGTMKSTEPRRSPMETIWPTQMDSSVEVQLPAGLSPETSVLVARKETQNGIHWSRSTNLQGSVLKLAFKYKRTPTKYAPQDVENYTKTVEDALSAAAPYLILQKK